MRILPYELPVQKPPQPRRNDHQIVIWRPGPAAQHCEPCGERQERGTGRVPLLTVGRGWARPCHCCGDREPGLLPHLCLAGRSFGRLPGPPPLHPAGWNSGLDLLSRKPEGPRLTYVTQTGLGAALEHLRFAGTRGCGGSVAPGGVACLPCPQAATGVSSAAAGVLPSGRF